MDLEPRFILMNIYDFHQRHYHWLVRTEAVYVQPEPQEEVAEVKKPLAELAEKKHDALLPYSPA